MQQSAADNDLHAMPKKPGPLLLPLLHAARGLTLNEAPSEKLTVAVALPGLNAMWVTTPVPGFLNTA